MVQSLELESILAERKQLREGLQERRRECETYRKENRF